MTPHTGDGRSEGKDALRVRAVTPHAYAQSLTKLHMTFQIFIFYFFSAILIFAACA
jgi:hypothetical protein